MKQTIHFPTILSILFACISLLSLSSCADEWMEYPYPNKDEIQVTGKIGKDTLYSLVDVNLIFSHTFLVQSDGTILWDTQKNNKNELNDGKNVIGKVEYDGDEISKIEIPDWCIITRFKRKKKQYGYIIEALGRKDLHMSLSLPYIGGSVEIK